MEPSQCCVLIPSLSPDDRLPQYVEALIGRGFGGVVVVNDGSAPSFQPFFDQVAAMPGCKVLAHPVNRGKGAALRTGLNYIDRETEFEGVITADSDGQHTPEDTLKMADALTGERMLWLGSRDFSSKNSLIPARSRFGNRTTSLVFRVLYGQWLPDTQTGLRAFPRELCPFLTQISGDRFEYEMNMLIRCAGNHILMKAVSIETVYLDENKSSHFHPVRDSIRIYKILLGNFFRFMSASLIATLADQGLFWLLNSAILITVIPDSATYSLPFISGSTRVLAASVLARVVSSLLNFKLNKAFVFTLHEKKGALARYFVLVVGVMLLSSLAVSALSALPGFPLKYLRVQVIKIIVDTLLFFLNYRIQKAWVFAGEE